MSGPRDDRQGDSTDVLARRFERERPYLRRIAYNTLGSFAEADDVVQEAWLRLQRVDAAAIDDLRAWLTTVVGRLALDALGTARARRERYVGPWLPEPSVSALSAATAAEGAAAAALQRGDGVVAGSASREVEAADPADRVSLDEEVTTALLVVLERLSPAERTAFVLHDVFGLGFPEVAEVVGRSPAAVRQLAARARRHVDDGTPRFPASREQHAEIVAAFAAAWQAGDVDGLVGVLDPEVVLTSDGGGLVTAARRPVVGSARVAKALAGFARLGMTPDANPRGGFAEVNGLPGLVVAAGDVINVVSFTVDDGRIVAIDIVRNPEKLRHVPSEVLAPFPEEGR